MIYSEEEWDEAIKEIQSHIGKGTLRGLISRVRYSFLGIKVDISEFAMDNAKELQDRRKKLDEVQRRLLESAREVEADIDNLRLLFAYQWEDFAVYMRLKSQEGSDT